MTTLHAPETIEHDPYKELFNNCNEANTLDGLPEDKQAAMRNVRMKLCHDNAMAATNR